MKKTNLAIKHIENPLECVEKLARCRSEVKALKQRIKTLQKQKSTIPDKTSTTTYTLTDLGRSEYVLIITRRSKNTRRYYRVEHVIKKSQVNLVRAIIINLTEGGERTTNYGEITDQLRRIMRIRVGRDAFNGGRNRRVMMELYYHPMVILKLLGFITYGAGGKTKLLLREKND
jgi:hypothetical protein